MSSKSKFQKNAFKTCRYFSTFVCNSWFHRHLSKMKDLSKCLENFLPMSGVFPPIPSFQRVKRVPPPFTNFQNKQNLAFFRELLSLPCWPLCVNPLLFKFIQVTVIIEQKGFILLIYIFKNFRQSTFLNVWKKSNKNSDRIIYQ